MAIRNPGIDQKQQIRYNSGTVNDWEKLMNTYQVSYTAYVGRSSQVLSEGTMQIQANQASQAENVVKSMFQGNDVIIRSVFG
jgi:hypothetical protein